MWTVKKTTTSMVAALAFSGLVSHGAWASEAALPVANSLSSEDLSFAFASSSEPVELVALSEQEMKETQGAVLPNLIGAGLGMVGYGTACLIQGNCTGAGFGYAAATGALSPVSGAMATIWGFNGAVAIGTGWGVGSSVGWW